MPVLSSNTYTPLCHCAFLPLVECEPRIIRPALVTLWGQIVRWHHVVEKELLFIITSGLAPFLLPKKEGRESELKELNAMCCRSDCRSERPRFILQRAVAFIFNLKEITVFLHLALTSPGFASILSFDRVCFPSFGSSPFQPCESITEHFLMALNFPLEKQISVSSQGESRKQKQEFRFHDG